MLRIEVAARTDVGRRRDHNEDYLGNLLLRQPKLYTQELLQKRGYLFAVADGMGGHEGGEVASEMAITSLFEKYYSGTGPILPDLEEAIKGANYNVYNRNDGNSTMRGRMGTTLTVALLRGNRVLIGNVGDSRIYLIRQGVLNRVTRDHSLVEEQLAIGAITEEQAKRSLVKNVITRAIGNQPDVQVDFFEPELEEGDTILLCSDGLYNMVDERQIGAVVATEPNLDKASLELIKLANEAGGSDNISVILVRVNTPGDPIPSMLEGFVSTPESIVSTQKTGGVQTTSRLPVVESAIGQAGMSYADFVANQTGKTEVYNPPVEPVKAPPLAELPPLPRPIPVQPPRDRGLNPILRALIVLLALIILVGAAYMLLNQNNAQPAAVPTPTLAMTVTPLAPTVAATELPTQTAIPPTNGSSVAPIATVTVPASLASAPNIPIGTQVAIAPTKVMDVQLLIQNYPTTPSSLLSGLTIEMHREDGAMVGAFHWDAVNPGSATSDGTFTLTIPGGLSDGTYTINIPTNANETPGTRRPQDAQLTVTSKNSAVFVSGNRIISATPQDRRLLITIDYTH